MDLVFFGIVIFLLLLAVFHLSVGVSNDAVNFLSSAIGSRAASFKRVIIVAAIGVFAGAAMSNGMMDVARHGIFRPESLSFYDVISIFMAVIVTDLILLDIFNTLGMPTSTTVSMVFELLGATFVVALFKMSDPGNAISLGEYLNTEKALSIIVGIFLSIAIAFVFGIVVQFLSRLLFKFEYKSQMKWKVGIFGGIATTAIIYFMLLKGIKDLSFMTPETKEWIATNTETILVISLIAFTVIMQCLHFLKVNVLKVIVLLGTFALAMAFAGNDLVNFVGVPLTSLASYQDYMAAGGNDVYGFMMNSLNGPAQTPVLFLVASGMIMVISLATSKKARAVTQTTVGLSSKDSGDEMFGSSRIARTLVRGTLNAFNWVSDHTPTPVKRWIGHRMDTTVTEPEEGAAFDLIRASVNLMLAGMLIALGTSLKLPLSTTFVTFMVAMGTSLADQAWGREIAVFRITGVISVIGGWFITAGVAFIGAGTVVSLMHLGGVPVMIAGGVIALVLLIRSNIRFRNKKKAIESDTLFQTILATDDQTEVWSLTRVYIAEKEKMFFDYAGTVYGDIIDGFINNNPKPLGRAARSLYLQKDVLKSQRRKLTLCMRRVAPATAIEKSTWFHLSNNMAMSITYNLRRINEMCKEHVDNNFMPLPKQYHKLLCDANNELADILAMGKEAIDNNNAELIDTLRRRCETLKQNFTSLARNVYDHLQNGDVSNISVSYVYLNLLQESQELVTSLRKMLRAAGKLNIAPNHYRSFTHVMTQPSDPE